MRLLATKVLPLPFKERLLQQNFSIVEHPFVTIEPLVIEPKKWEKHIILTSQNATKIFLAQTDSTHWIQDLIFYCVGAKSAALLNEKKAVVQEVASSASQLAATIVAHYKDKRFSYWCGIKRLRIIEDILNEAHISLHIYEVYNTLLTPKKIASRPDGILFYSPSAVESYLQQNSLEGIHSFCIGPTTAHKVQEYSSYYSVAKEPSNNFIFLQLMQHYYA